MTVAVETGLHNAPPLQAPVLPVPGWMLLADTSSAPHYRFVDDDPDVAFARGIVRERALTLLEERRARITESFAMAAVTGGTPERPLEIDALSTADKVLAAEKEFGKDSEQYQTLRLGLVADNRRMLGEWYRKKRPEYFERLRHSFDEAKQSYFSNGIDLGQMTENGIVPMPDDPEDEARRVNDHVEEATPLILRNLGRAALAAEQGAETRVRTLSACTMKALRDYNYDIKNKQKHRGYKGYVPEIDKWMFRDHILDTRSNDRFEEVIALPGIFITTDIVGMYFAEKGLDISGMDRTDIHGAQIEAHDDLIDFVRGLDRIASDEWCVEVFMGEKVDKDFVKDYDGFREQALQRQRELSDHAETVTNFVLDLAATKYDRHKAPAKVEAFVKLILLDVGKENFKLAEQMFDTRTAEGLQEVVRLESIGENERANQVMKEVVRMAPSGGSCGGGSCGLETVDINSKAGKELAQELDIKPGDKVAEDKERPCGKCGKMTIVYVWNDSEFTKHCQGCKHTEHVVTGKK